jgi:3-deoxy-D-manno-octulosonic-acid transferase
VFVLYNILLLAIVVLGFPLILAQIMSSQKRPNDMTARLRSRGLAFESNRRPVWIHALSVGEVLASIPLVQELHRRCGPQSVVLSVSTIAGHEVAKKSLQPYVAGLFFFPYDLIWSVRKVIRSIKPTLFILVESDIWPNFTHEMKRQGVPFVVVNARMSPKSFRGYRRFSFFFKHMFSNVSSICTQTERDASRFVAVGAATDRVLVTGNMKFDQPAVSRTNDEIDTLRTSMKIRTNDTVFLAGSTHEGEEEILLHCLSRLRETFPRLVLVVAPRNTGRAAEIQRMFLHAGFLVSLKTELARMEEDWAPDVVILDTLGELRQVYALADVVFVGKSIVPLGGQNPIEPAAWGKPILFGPHMFNFELASETLLREGGAFEVENDAELCKQLNRLLLDSRYRDKMGAKAYEVFRMNQGATERTLKVIEGFL